MKNRYIFMCFLLLLFFATSCVEEFVADIPESEENVLVVEGSIFSDSTSILNISYSTSLQNKQKKPEENAKVILKGSDGSQVEAVKNGYYVKSELFSDATRVEQDFRGQYRFWKTHLKSDVEYWVEIKVGNYTYESEPMKPLDAPEIDSIEYQQVRDDKKVEILVNTVPYGDADGMVYTSWEFLEAWEIHTPNTTQYEWDPFEMCLIKLDKTQYTNKGWKEQNNLNPIVFSSKEKVQKETIHTIECTDDRLQTCYFIRVKDYAISRAEYEYFTTRNQQSNDVSGLFSPMPTELPTNIHCTDKSRKAIGFVGIRGKVNQTEIHFLKKDVYYEDTHKKVSPPEEALAGKSNTQLWNEGYRILVYDPNEHTLRWTYAWWVDCRVSPWFASLTMPACWNGKWTKGE